MINVYNGTVIIDGDPIDEIKALAKRVAEANGYPDNWDQKGWPTNLGPACAVNSINDLYNLLNEYGPLYANYNEGRNKCGEPVAHMVVVIGVDVHANIVYVNNPWNGYHGKQTFQQFMQTVAYSSPDSYGMRFDSIYIPI